MVCSGSGRGTVSPGRISDPPGGTAAEVLAARFRSAPRRGPAGIAARRVEHERSKPDERHAGRRAVRRSCRGVMKCMVFLRRRLDRIPLRDCSMKERPGRGVNAATAPARILPRRPGRACALSAPAQPVRRWCAAVRRSAVVSAASAMISGSMPAESPSAQASLWFSTAVSRFSSLTSASRSVKPCSIPESQPFQAVDRAFRIQLDHVPLMSR